MPGLRLSDKVDKMMWHQSLVGQSGGAKNLRGTIIWWVGLDEGSFFHLE